MKQIAQYQDGRLELQEVPRPTAPPGGVLVRTTHSVISLGTERMKVEQAKMNLLQKARARPDQVRKVLDSARNLGWRSALEKVRNRLESPTPLGYSAAGVVEVVDAGNTRFRVGDRVACAGAECAFHAEFLAVPDLLVARVPAEVPNWKAAYATLCSIALQAVRQTAPCLGDRALVMGQGLVGLLVTNLLEANGVRVMAVDVQPGRRRFAEAMGAEKVVILGSGQEVNEEVRVWTEGCGVDAAVICTGTSSNAPIEQAAHALRDRGRLVDVGITKIELPWKLFYEKELEVRFSRSYGPGRYDPAYEWAGQDYPIGYVRWTEQRNLEACLHLIGGGRIRLEALTTRRARFRDALEVYADLMREGADDLGVVLEYGVADGTPAQGGGPVHPGRSGETGKPATEDLERRQGRELPGAESSGARATQAGYLERKEEAKSGTLGTDPPCLDVIGAGNFARTMLLPHLKGRIRLRRVVTQTALNANHVKTKFGFETAGTDAAELWNQGGTGAVLIATRHHLHAPLLLEALQRHRAAFVEKPLCLTRDELGEIDAAVAGSRGSVMVGFNRRFAPAAVALREILREKAGGKGLSYRVMAGPLDPAHWYANYAESGGRVVGEVCHFLDLFCFLVGSRPTRLSACRIGAAAGRLPYPDSVSVQVEFEDGSCGQLIYSAEGDSRFPKETLTVFAPGLVAELVNFQEMVLYRQRKRTVRRFTSKGHGEEMAAWLEFLAGRRTEPLPYAETRTAMRLTFAVLDSIREGSAVPV